MKAQEFVALGLLLLLVSPMLVSAVEFSQPSEKDKDTYDQMLTPVAKIYNLVKYVSSGIAGLVLLFAGIGYMTSGSDPKKRENAKSMAMYVIIGLVIIWAAPLVVQLIVG